MGRRSCNEKNQKQTTKSVPCYYASFWSRISIIGTMAVLLGSISSVCCAHSSCFNLNQLNSVSKLLKHLFIFYRVPQPEFLGALVEHFSTQKLKSSNSTILADDTILQKGGRKPLLFGLIVDALQTNYPQQFGEKFEAYFYATAVVLASAFNVMLMHPYLLSQMHLGMKMRVALCSMIYRKSLRLSKNALGETTVGQVVNLLSNDVGRLDIAIIFLHFLWVGPIETIAVTYLMYSKVKLLCLVYYNPLETI